MRICLQSSTESQSYFHGYTGLFRNIGDSFNTSYLTCSSGLGWIRIRSRLLLVVCLLGMDPLILIDRMLMLISSLHVCAVDILCIDPVVCNRSRVNGHNSLSVMCRRVVSHAMPSSSLQSLCRKLRYLHKAPFIGPLHTVHHSIKYSSSNHSRQRTAPTNRIVIE